MRSVAFLLSLVICMSAGPALALGTDLIAYFHGEWGDLNIYTIPAAGGLPTQLTSNAGNNVDPEWSPDGTRIAFQSDRDGTEAIYIMNVDGSDQMRVSPPGTRARQPSWSPDGTQILFTHINSSTVAVMNIDGTEVRSLIPPALRAWNAKWSIEGTQIVFETDRDGDPEIYVMNADGSDTMQLTSNNISDQHPVLSPNGRWIAYNSSAPGRQDFDLFVMAVDGTSVRRVTTATEHDEYASWSPDGQQLVYAYANSAIFIINADGTGNRRLTPTAFWTAGPAWQPTNNE